MCCFIKSQSLKNNKFKIFSSTWNEEVQLPDGSYPVSDIQDQFEHIFKKYEIVTDNPSIMIYVNKIENRTTFEIKTEYYLELLIPQTIELIGSTEIKITKDDKMVKIYLI